MRNVKTIVVKHAKLLDETLCDIRIEDNIICEIAPDITCASNEIIELDGTSYVSAGWIDLHTHCFRKFSLYGDDIDTIGWKSGVTCVVDAGTSGSDTIAEFYEQSRQAKTNVFAFLNIAKQGISAQNELADIENLALDGILNAVNKYPSFIVGLKARMSKSVIQNTGNAPLDFARYAANLLSLPIMVHIGNEPATLSDICDRLLTGDIITHIFNPKQNGVLDNHGLLKPYVSKAHAAGVWFDLGHGSESFSFDTCINAKKQGLECDTISTDIYFRNREQGPVYSLAMTMSKMLAIGYSLENIIEKVTRIPARILKKAELGKLEVGAQADITIFKIEEGNFSAFDSLGKEVKLKQRFQPHAVVMKGEYLKMPGGETYE